MKVLREFTKEKQTFKTKKGYLTLLTLREETSAVDLRREEDFLQKIKSTAGNHTN